MFKSGFKALPVCDFSHFATFSGVPHTTTLPPRAPPSGPISIIWSTHFMTLRLCSIMRTVCPRLMRALNAVISLRMSWVCSPVVGSSKMKNV